MAAGKLKTKKAASKRFIILKSGGIKRNHACKHHKLSGRRRDTLRRLDDKPMMTTETHGHYMTNLKRMLPYLKKS